MEEKLKKLVLDLYSVSITSDTELSDVIEDSLTAIEFLFEVEREFGCVIHPEEILELKTFGNLLKVLGNDKK